MGENPVTNHDYVESPEPKTGTAKRSSADTMVSYNSCLTVSDVPTSFSAENFQNSKIETKLLTSRSGNSTKVVKFNRADEIRNAATAQGPPSSLRILHKLLWIALFAYMGVLARVTLTSLSGYGSFLNDQGAGYFLPNIVGCFTMGIMASLTPIFTHYPAVYAGICVGFCGSCTTFATWQAKVVLIFLSGQIDKGLCHILLIFCTSYCSFQFGKHAGLAMMWMCSKIYRCGQSSAEETRLDQNVSAAIRRRRASSVATLIPHFTSFTYVREEEDPPTTAVAITDINYRFSTAVAGFISLTLLFWIAAFQDPNETRRKWWISVSFGPGGAIVRFVLSLYNKKFPNFPLFTFIANIVASSINVMLYMSGQYHVSVGILESNKDRFNFWALSGLSTGFMGSLSTVSSWVNEINKFTLSGGTCFAYRYGLVSVVCTQIVGLIIGGIWQHYGATDT